MGFNRKNNKKGGKLMGKMNEINMIIRTELRFYKIAIAIITVAVIIYAIYTAKVIDIQAQYIEQLQETIHMQSAEIESLRDVVF